MSWAAKAISEANEVGNMLWVWLFFFKVELLDNEEPCAIICKLMYCCSHLCFWQVVTFIRNHQWSDALYKRKAQREPPALDLLKPGMVICPKNVLYGKLQVFP